VISLDYLYLGLSYIKATIGTDVTVAEPMMFNKGIELLKKAATMEKAVVDELSELVKGFMSKNFTKSSSNLRNLYLK
jgi:uncharacterized protein YaaN involved in tellurite resistance